jgi:hypothetical protein
MRLSTAHYKLIYVLMQRWAPRGCKARDGSLSENSCRQVVLGRNGQTVTRVADWRTNDANPVDLPKNAELETM